MKRMTKKDYVCKFGLNYVEIKAFADCNGFGTPFKYIVDYLMIKCRLKKRTIYSHYRKYLQIMCKIDDKKDPIK